MATGSRMFSIADFGIQSSWENQGGQITSGPTTGKTTKTVDVQIPDDYTSIDSVEMSVTCGSTVGGAAILDVAGIDLEPYVTNVVDLSSVITTAGVTSLQFRYKDRGRASLSDGPHSMTMSFRAITVTVTYTVPDPEPPEDPDVPLGTEESHGLITIHDGGDRDFGASLGLGVLTPKQCVVSEEAGGNYSLSMLHPFTLDGREKLIQPWQLVRVPVPMSDTPAMDGSGGITAGYEIWVVSASATGLYDRNYYTRYPNWVAGTTYAVGAYVRHSGRNYRCKVPNNYSIWVPGCWTDLGTGDPKSTKSVANGTRLYVSVVGSTWLTVKLSTGETGYCIRADCTYVRIATQEDIDALKTTARSIRAQVFRITDVTVDGKGVQASGLHVSYDYSMEVLSGLTINDSDLPETVLDLKACVLGSSDIPDIYCEDTGTTITTSWAAGTSPVEALLSPESGLVAQSRARLIRDNWDFFLLTNTGDDRGYRLVYGVNLTGVTWKRDFSSVVTRVIPVGANSDGTPLYLDTEGGGTIYVESSLVNNYSVVAYEYLATGIKVGEDDPDGNPYTVQTARAEMQRLAECRFADDHIDEPKVDLTVTFVQLGTTEDYKQYKALERISLYDFVTIEHPDLGLETKAQVKAYEWDAITQTFTSITLGDVFHHNTASLAGWEIADGAITPRKLSDAARSALGI